MEEDQVQFEENYYSGSKINDLQGGSKLTNFIIEKSGGLIENEDQAIKVLVFVGVVALILTIIVFYISVKGPSAPSADEIVPVAGPSDPNNFNF
jgi:hypothetical protein